MPAKRKSAVLDFQLLDNGTATATVTGALDAAGNAVPLPIGLSPVVFTSSSPAISVGATNPDGVSVPLTPTALATGVVITATATEADGVTTLTGNGTPIDVVTGPAASLAIAEQ